MPIPLLTRFRRLGLYFRILVYLGVLVALVTTRKWTPPTGDSFRLPQFSRADSTLVVAGHDLAPTLVTQLAAGYRRDYPKLDLLLTGGGTTAALEALLNQRADVGFLASPPEPREQALFRNAAGGSAPGDSALWFPVALGALIVVRASDGPALDSVNVPELRGLIGGPAHAGEAAPASEERTETRVRRLYLAHPDLGLWNILRERLGLAADTTLVRSPRLAFLAGDAEVLDAVRGDREALGIVSSFHLDDGQSAPGLRTLPVGGSPGEPAAAPTVENIGYGRYPLHQHLYVACLPRGGILGSMFVTHLTSDRGQRRVERAGFIPARLILREIVLSRDPVGGGQ